MADRYRGTMYVGVTARLPARTLQHRTGEGSDFCWRYGLIQLVWAEYCESIESCIAQEKRIKKWRREWKFALIKEATRNGPTCSTRWSEVTRSGTPGQARGDDERATWL